MSTSAFNPNRPPDAGATPIGPDDPADGGEPDGPEQPGPEGAWARYRDPGVRNYLFAGLAALAMVFVVLFERGSDLGGLLLVVLGVFGLALRWAAAPPAFVLVLTYFLAFPFGVPDPVPRGGFEILDSRFRVADLLLAFSVVIYLACQYRVLGLVSQAIPFDTRVPGKDEEPTRRPAALIRPGEIARLLWLTGGVVLAGQLAWLFVTSAEVIPGEAFPLRLVSTGRVYGGGGTRAGLSEPAARFVVLAGLIFFPALLARLVFGYWRLKVMGPAEARMVVLDTAWNETRREHDRVEKWRARGRRRAAERAESAREGKG
jgi:hypothetical protein